MGTCTDKRLHESNCQPFMTVIRLKLKESITPFLKSFLFTRLRARSNAVLIISLTIFSALLALSVMIPAFHLSWTWICQTKHLDDRETVTNAASAGAPNKGTTDGKNFCTKVTVVCFLLPCCQFYLHVYLYYLSICRQIRWLSVSLESGFIFSKWITKCEPLFLPEVKMYFKYLFYTEKLYIFFSRFFLET